MNHSWRPPPLPPIPGSNTNICPICSISHFPFCPSPLPFIENPRFHHPQPHNDYYLQRPHLDHHHPFPNHQSSSNYYNYDARRPTWYACNPRLDMIPYDGIEENYSNHPRGGVASASYGYDGYDNGGIKRPKIEITDNNRAPGGTFTGGEVPDTARIPSDNERILKLIHDHGNVSSGHERLGETCEVRVDMGLKRKRETSEFSSVSMGSLNYSRYSNQLSPTADAMQHHLQPNHNSQPPYNWSESKGHYGGPVEVGHGYGGQPPLPASPPPPLPIDPPRNHFFDQIALPPTKKPSLFPVAIGSSADSAIHGNQSSAQVYHTNNSGRHGSTLSSAEEFHALQSSEKHVRDIQPFQLQTISSDKPNIIDATLIFKQPHRASRPDHLVIILRGLPGSGKSYLAKLLRDIEVENGGEAPRIHSMDEYFMTEVEKAEDSELSKSSGSLRGKRQVMKTVMEYCYEPEMEEAYRASMLKAFKKTLDEGVYSFIIVDDRNLRVADFAQFWATAKRSGYEVYLVEASYKDPAGCAARNVHNFTLDDIQKMAGQWEEAPSLYLKMDIKSLLHGDGFDESGIQEVDMDMEDEDAVDASQKSVTRSPQNDIKNQVDDFTPHDVGEVKDVKHPTGGVNHLSRSKWSNDLDASGTHKTEGGKEKKSLLAGLIQAYSKEGKSVSWGDQGGNVGFSISATRKTNTRSLVIGPGSGYNLKSNPLSEEEYLKPARNSVELKSQNVFQERIRAERESFKAVFDKRRQRIGGFNVDDE